MTKNASRTISSQADYDYAARLVSVANFHRLIATAGAVFGLAMILSACTGHVNDHPGLIGSFGAVVVVTAVLDFLWYSWVARRVRADMRDCDDPTWRGV